SVEGIKNTLWLAGGPPGMGELPHHLIALPPRAQGKGSTTNFFQGIHGVTNNCEAALEELIAVAPNARKIRRNLALYSNPPAFHAKQFHLQRTMQQGAHIQQFLFSWCLLRKTEQTSHQVTGAPRLLADFL